MSLFHHIALIGRAHVPNIQETLNALHDVLIQQGCVVWSENSAHNDLHHFIPKDASLDLCIAVGGDGSMLSAAKIAVAHHAPVLGVNRGKLGFLADIHPRHLSSIQDILDGGFQEEKRILLTATHNNTQYLAVNDVVLMADRTGRMIEFDVWVDEKIMCPYRSDGLIVATPTGSTAYALSGGGPILYPSLPVVVMVPMFPHTLSSRPIVIHQEQRITLKMHSTHTALLSCDGCEPIPVQAGEHIDIQKHDTFLRLIHPIDYDYFRILREKLAWERC